MSPSFLVPTLELLPKTLEYSEGILGHSSLHLEQYLNRNDSCVTLTGHLNQPEPFICTFVYSGVCGCLTRVKSTLTSFRDCPDVHERGISDPCAILHQRPAAGQIPLDTELEAPGNFSSHSQPKGEAMVPPEE